MKKLLKIFGLLFISAFLFSCGTTEVEEADGPEQIFEFDDIIMRGTNPDPSKLGKNKLLSVTKKVSKPVYFTFTKWAKIRTTTELLDELQLNSVLTNEQKYDFMSYIFDDLPKNVDDGVVREVSLGKYFSKGKKPEERDLGIQIVVMTPGKDATVPNEKVIVFYTNVLSSNGKPLKDKGKYVSLDKNICLITGYNKKLMTSVEFIKADQNNKADTSKYSDIQKILYIQNLLMDEDITNDKKAHTMATAMMNDAKLQPSLKIFAMIFEFDYRVSIEDVAGAQKIWNEILDYSDQVPGDMTRENLETSNGDILYLLRRLTNK